MALSGGGSRARKRQRRGQQARGGVALTMSDIKRNARTLGSQWFGPGALRFFGSRVHSKVYPGAKCSYFVSSERTGPRETERRYTVRRACGGRIGTQGDFLAYKTSAQAHAAARKIAQREKKKKKK